MPISSRGRTARSLPLFGFAAVLLILAFPQAAKAHAGATAPEPQRDGREEAKAVNTAAEAVVRNIVVLREASEAATRRLRRLTLRRQREELRKLPPGVYADVPAFWRGVKTPAELLELVPWFGEPIGPDRLTALARLLPRADRNQGLRMAAWLYRYRREDGRRYLLRAAADPAGGIQAEQAAYILALNRDEAALGAIEGLLRRGRWRSSGLYAAVGDWPHPRLTAALVAVHSRAADHDKPFLLAALALHGARTLAPSLRARLDAAAPGGEKETRRVAAALLRLGTADDRALAWRYLAAQHGGSAPSADRDIDSRRVDVVMALSEVRAPQAAALLERNVRAYSGQTRRPTTAGDLLAPENMALVNARSLAMLSSEGLARMRSRTSNGVVLDLAERLLADEKADGAGLTSSFPVEMAEAALILGAPHGRLEAAFGRDWVRQTLALRRLRRLPDGSGPAVEIFLN